MIEGETDIGNHSLGLHQAANDGIHTKILFVIYGMKGNDSSCVIRPLKTAVVLNVLTSLHCTILHLTDNAFTSLGITSFHLSSLQMSCHVKCSEVS